uniref:SUMO-activating enzyme subunit n=1 Tax=Timema shepardi TaxID=629360 RepID=A0A7R9G304_TIMSH|nr:unnamed protein product [Timema shepardi]
MKGDLRRLDWTDRHWADDRASRRVITLNYGVGFFKKFSVVLNALDNRAARNHVNRMCLAANVPLVESGTAGYDGQVELIKKGLTNCYECFPKAQQKTYPSCTIRNTPSEPIHCIVWAKHLFNQLFGEEDPDQDVSPDTADPEAAGNAGEKALNSEVVSSERVSTRKWAQACQYNAAKLFKKLFHNDVKYLLSMDKLWGEHRRPPVPLDLDKLPDAVAGSSRSDDTVLPDNQKVWSIQEWGRIFSESCNRLKMKFQSIEEKDHLVWDKDDEDSMNFVAASANLRAQVFNIPQTPLFDVKSMAGNIIPAIATSNAIVAGLVVLHAFNVLQERLDRCKTVYVRLRPNPRGYVVVPEKVFVPPVKNCCVCSEKPTAIAGPSSRLNDSDILDYLDTIDNDFVNESDSDITSDDVNVPDLSNPAVHNLSDSDDEDDREILSPEQPLPLPFSFQELTGPKHMPPPDSLPVTLFLDVNTMTVRMLTENVLKKALNMVQPDAILEATGNIIISSEPGETDQNNDKKLCEMGIRDDSILTVDDYVQNYELTVNISHRVAPKDGPEFEVVADPEMLKPKSEDDRPVTNGNNEEEKEAQKVEDEDDVMEVIPQEDVLEVKEPHRKREAQEDLENPHKKLKTTNIQDGGVLKYKRKTGNEEMESEEDIVTVE